MHARPRIRPCGQHICSRIGTTAYLSTRWPVLGSGLPVSPRPLASEQSGGSQFAAKPTLRHRSTLFAKTSIGAMRRSRRTAAPQAAAADSSKEVSAKTGV
jgi:hypothetical protein